MKKITFLTSFVALTFAVPAMAVPSNTSSTFPSNGVMEEDYTYTGQANVTNLKVSSGTATTTASYANCPTAFPNSDEGATSTDECYTACTVSDFPANSHIASVTGKNYSGANVTDTCAIATCDTGYTLNNGACNANVISITWADASAEDIAANEAGTVTYGGDIRTPRKAVHKPGKIFTGWTFVSPLAVLMENVDTNGSAYTPSKADGSTSWSTTFNYGTITGTSLCSSTAGTTQGATGTPDESGTGDTKFCWCRMDNFTPTNGATISAQSLWVFDYSSSSADACARNCANDCGYNAQANSALRGGLFGSLN